MSTVGHFFFFFLKNTLCTPTDSADRDMSRVTVPGEDPVEKTEGEDDDNDSYVPPHDQSSLLVSDPNRVSESVVR